MMTAHASVDAHADRRVAWLLAILIALISLWPLATRAAQEDAQFADALGALTSSSFKDKAQAINALIAKQANSQVIDELMANEANIDAMR